MKYLATFATVAEAVRAAQTLDWNLDILSDVVPVPRQINSTCGAALRYEAAERIPLEESALYEAEEGYRKVYEDPDFLWSAEEYAERVAGGGANHE